MFRKVICHGPEATEKFLEGVKMVDKMVGGTLGPGGYNRIIQEKYRSPLIINDGAQVARRIVLEDPIEDMAAQTIIEIAMETSEQAGDGTTAAVVIAAALTNKCMTLLKEQAEKSDLQHNKNDVWINPMQLRREIQSERDKAIKILAKFSRKLEGEDLANIISTSLEGHEYGKTLTELIKKVGEDGYVSVEDNWHTQYGISTELVTGMKFLAKTASGYFATTKNKKEAVWENTHVLVTNHKFEASTPLATVIQQLRATGARKLVLMCGFSEGPSGYSRSFIEALNVAVQTANRPGADNTLLLAVSVPSLTTPELEDVAVFCDAKFIDKNLKMDLGAVKIEDLGFAKKISVDDSEANIIGGKGDAKARIEVLKEQVKVDKDQMFKNKLKRRIASLSSGQGIVRVGAQTDSERTYIREKLHDAVSAAKAAMAEGVVKGGGLALRDVAEKLGEKSILYEALRSTSERIAFNAGWSEVKDDGSIIDPHKVVRLSLENACSGAGILITADGAIAEEKLDFMQYMEKAMHKLVPSDERSDWRDDENQDEAVPREVN